MNATAVEPGTHHEALLQLLRTSESIWNASRVFFDQWDLSPSQFNILNVLRDHPDGTTQIELSRTLIMHRSNVTGMIDRLEQRRLVARRDNPDDRRAYRIVLTKDAHKLLDEVLPAYYGAAEAVFAGFSRKRSRELTDELVAIERGVAGFTETLPR